VNDIQTLHTLRQSLLNEDSQLNTLSNERDAISGDVQVHAVDEDSRASTLTQ
jgi:hypothetical protein